LASQSLTAFPAASLAEDPSGLGTGEIGIGGATSSES